MLRQPIRTAVATFQVACGLIGVLFSTFAVTYLINPSSVDTARGLLAAILVVLGIPLFAVWMAARTRRRWLLALAVISGVLTVAMIIVTALLYAPARVNEQLGVWLGVAVAAVCAVLWWLIMVAAIIETRLLPRSETPAPRGWTYIPAVAVPLVAVTALVLLLVSAGPGWLIRLNGRVSDVTPAAAAEGSALTGDSRWTVDLDATQPALPIGTGVAVPVPRDQDHSAGVTMMDPTTGETRWRFQLRGADGAPELAATDSGDGVAVSFDGSDLGEGIPSQTFTLSGDSGEVQAVWPATGSVRGTDPPVLFDKDPQGTNAVIALSPTGGKLWTYKPERCADPRSASSAPSIVMVRAKECGKHRTELQIIGLDAQTGDRRWVQDAAPDESEDGPDNVLVRPGYQLELSGADFARRSLDTGSVDWVVASIADCSEHYLKASTETAYVGECADEQADEPSSVTAYAAQSGRRDWMQRLNAPITAMEAVDDRRVLALTDGADGCAVHVVRESGATTLMKLPGGSRSSEQESGGVLDCSDAELIRIGNSIVLQVRLPSNSASGAERYRFIGLA